MNHKHPKLQQTLTASQPLTWQNNSSSTHDFNLWIFTPRQDTMLRCCFRRFRLRRSRRFRWFRFLHFFVLLDEFQHLQGTTLLLRSCRDHGEISDRRISFFSERRWLRKVVYFSPLSKEGGAKNVWQFLGGYDQGWPKNDVVFFWLWVHKLFLFLVLDLNHQILHWNTPCFTNIRIASSIWMNPSLCVSPSCKHLCH